MIPAWHIFTGDDGHSHFTRGHLAEGFNVPADHVHFKESPVHATYDWHNDPIPQYVITLSGELEFTVHDGSTFVLKPGEILLATDHTGSGHKWRMLNDDPWRRAYVVYREGADTHFVADPA